MRVVGLLLGSLLVLGSTACGSEATPTAADDATTVVGGGAVEIEPSFRFSPSEMLSYSGALLVADDLDAARTGLEELFPDAVPAGVDEVLVAVDFDRSFVVGEILDPCRSSAALFVVDDDWLIGDPPESPDSACDAVASEWALYVVDRVHRPAF